VCCFVRSTIGVSPSAVDFSQLLGRYCAFPLVKAFGLRYGTDSTTDPYASFGGQFGYYADAKTGLELLGHRYYDSGTGRFVDEDPIGYNGGADLYAYCGNNPITESGPEGTDDGAGDWTTPVGYGSQVLNVFKGYGDLLNPFKLIQNVQQVGTYLGTHADTDEAAAVLNIGKGFVHGVTLFATTDDSRDFGQSFGNDVLLLTPFLVRVTSFTDAITPGEYLTCKAPMQVTPGIRILEGVYLTDGKVPRVQSWKAYYDEYGRLRARTDYNAKNVAHRIADTHYHTYFYDNTYIYQTAKHVPGEYSP
jgi:RHS repeat-associated protein